MFGFLSWAPSPVYLRLMISLRQEALQEPSPEASWPGWRGHAQPQRPARAGLLSLTLPSAAGHSSSMRADGHRAGCSLGTPCRGLGSLCPDPSSAALSCSSGHPGLPRPSAASPRPGEHTRVYLGLLHLSPKALQAVSSGHPQGQPSFAVRCPVSCKPF